MQKGVLKVKLLEVSSQYFNERVITIGLRGDESFWEAGKAKCPSKFEDVQTIFPLAQNIQVSVFENQQTDTRYGYFKIPMSKLYEYPNKNHVINTRCVWVEKSEDKVEEGVAAEVKLSMIFLPSASCSLAIQIESAELIRDVESVGKMDPYVECQVGDVSSKTDTQEGGGKNPVWNQSLTFLLESIPPSIIFTVKDQDMVNDDIVGRAKINPHQSKWFREENIAREIQIQFEGNKSGVIKTTTLFSMNL